MPHPTIPGFTHRRVPVDEGVALHAAVGGTGSPVVLLHGFPQTHLMWRHVAADLAADHTVICPDLRGYGDSDKPADSLVAAAKERGIDLQVETQGSSASTPLDPSIIAAADAVIFAVDVGVRDRHHKRPADRRGRTMGPMSHQQAAHAVRDQHRWD